MTNILLFCLIAGAVVVAGYFGFRFLKNLLSRPIPEIHLSQLDEPKWTDRQKITDLVYSFHQKGFESAGDYECPEFPSLTISGFVHPAEQMTGVIYDHPEQGIWVDIFVQYNDGGSLTVSNSPTGHELDHMPQQTKLYSKGSSVHELFEKAMAGRKKAGRITITKEEFAPSFEEAYQKEMKWRIDRGGPTYLEVRKIAEGMGVSTDRGKLEKATHKLQTVWEKEGWKPAKIANRPFVAGLPGVFQRPEEFRRKLEKQSGPPPRLSVPELPVYLILISAMVCWVYYGFQYNKTHFPSSITDLLVFFGVFLVPFLILMVFREFNRRVKMYPGLKRMASLRPGAFLVVDGKFPSLFYARDTWIGKVSFEEGSENQNAFTRLDSRVSQPLGQLEIRRKSILDKLSGRPEKDIIQMPESDFSRKFVVSGTETEFARKLLDSTVPGAIMRLAKFGQPFVEFEGSKVRVEVEIDLSGPRKEDTLRHFLEEAETIIEMAAQ